MAKVWPAGALATALLQQTASTTSNASSAAPSGLGCFIANAAKPAQVQIAVTKPSAAYISQSIVQLVRAIRLLLSNQTHTSPLETLYRLTVHVVAYASKDEIHDLYDTVKIEIERAAGVQAHILQSAGASESSFTAHLSWLSKLQATWSAWCETISLVRNILLPLDRWIANEVDDRLPIWELALDVFGHRFLQDATLSQTILSSINAAINADRQGEYAYQPMHVAMTAMFTSLNSEMVLDSAIAQATVDFYAAESKAFLASSSPAAYLVYANGRVNQEVKRSEWCLTTVKGRKENIAASQEQLIAQHCPALLAGLPSLLDDRSLDKLSIMYTLIKTIGKTAELRKCFADYIKARGEAVVNDKAKDEDMIDRLLEFKGLVDSVVFTCFQKDKEFANAQKDSFEVFINKREDKPAELIAKFLDAKLRSGNKTMSDSELEHVMDEAMILFRYTHAKDMFEEFYKGYFAKRLLLNRSASSDAERSMLLKLKEECGAGFTAKLETMIKDVDVSKDLMDEYQRYSAKTAAAEAIDFEVGVSVLTQAQWPTYPQLDVVLPNELNVAANHFTEFYQTRSSGRRLHWQHSLGTLSMLTLFPKAGSKELQVSTFQGIILMLFNAEDKLSYAAIKAATGLDDKELKRTLQSLACGQIPTRVLRKMPQGKDVADTDDFVFNDNFKNERHRIRINQIQMKETAEEQKSTEQRVFLDRDLILQAAAVRVLKAKKTIKHSDLVTEVVEQIKSRFAIEVSEIKKVFEILIEKEYMERVEGERGVYRYLA